MNIRPHSTQCEQGKPCIRCYKRRWFDSKTQEYKDAKQSKNSEWNRANSTKIKLAAERRKTHGNSYGKPRGEDWVKEQKIKGRASYAERYSLKKSEMLYTNKKWREANLEKLRYYAAKHRAAKLRATPSWADLAKIKSFYSICPEGIEVDHVIPLQGRTVCGLHVHYNLQYLEASANRAKGNRLKEG